MECWVISYCVGNRIIAEGVYNKMTDRRHNIPITLDYRVAYTVIQGLKNWLIKLEEMLDKAVVDSGQEIPCRRKTDKDRRKRDYHKPAPGAYM